MKSKGRGRDRTRACTIFRENCESRFIIVEILLCMHFYVQTRAYIFVSSFLSTAFLMTKLRGCRADRRTVVGFIRISCLPSLSSLSLSSPFSVPRSTVRKLGDRMANRRYRVLPSAPQWEQTWDLISNR